MNGNHRADNAGPGDNKGTDGRLRDQWSSQAKPGNESRGSGANPSGGSGTLVDDDPGTWAGDDAIHDGDNCTGGHITVSLFVEPTERIVGKAAVCVPYEVSRRAAGFSFPLPRGLAKTVAADREVIVTTPTGEALPRWLRYDAARRVIVVSTVRAGALPLQVLVTVRGQQTLLTITEKSNPGSGGH